MVFEATHSSWRYKQRVESQKVTTCLNICKDTVTFEKKHQSKNILKTRKALPNHHHHNKCMHNLSSKVKRAQNMRVQKDESKPVTCTPGFFLFLSCVFSFLFPCSTWRTYGLVYRLVKRSENDFKTIFLSVI